MKRDEKLLLREGKGRAELLRLRRGGWGLDEGAPMKRQRIATGFDCEPLPDGNVLIEFYAEDGETFNSQVVVRDVIQSMPTVAQLTELLLEKGPDAVREAMKQHPAEGNYKQLHRAGE